jgi:hypothetical protein
MQLTMIMHAAAADAARASYTQQQLLFGAQDALKAVRSCIINITNPRCQGLKNLQCMLCGQAQKQLRCEHATSVRMLMKQCMCMICSEQHAAHNIQMPYKSSASSLELYKTCCLVSHQKSWLKQTVTS